MRRLPFVCTVLGAVLLTSGLLGIGAARSAQATQRADLQRDVQRSTAAFEAYFERARALDLLLAQNPALSDFYRDAHGDRRVLRRGGPVVDGMDQALGYLQVLVRNIGEACFIDVSGKENARVVNGTRAAYADLSLNEAANPFFAPTFDQPVGVVYQAAPYLSPDTKTWVISNSTAIRVDGKKRALVHFEVGLASFLDDLPTSSSGIRSVVIDRDTGQVVLSDTGDAASAVPVRAPRWVRDIPADARGRFDVDGHPGAFRAITAAQGNANHWVVQAWSVSNPVLVPSWVGGVAAVLGGLLIIGALVGLRRQHQTLRRAARLDHLTGLGNRTALETALNEAIAASVASEERCGLLVIDLDGFKQINDTFGHHRGDEILQEIARRLHANTFEYDTAARVGGDEFAVVLRRLTGPDDALAVAHRLHEALTRPIELEGVQRFVGASIGVTAHPSHGITADELLRNADAAMYAVKRDRAAPRLYEPGTSTGADELELAAELLIGIDRGEITVYYQPEVDLATGRTVAYEALARWQHPTRGLVPPMDFIPLAERTGLIRPLTLAVVNRAVEDAVTWSELPEAPRVSINLSAQLLGDEALIGEVLSIIDARGLPADRLAVEITESAIIRDRDAAVTCLTRLRDAGVRVELDDFGSGYASFGHLRDLPLDAVKLDRSLISPLLDRTDARHILRSTVEVIHALGYQIVGEGVEDEAQLDILRRVGCEIVQGFLYSPPVPADQLGAISSPR